jgi:copper(I)-binding protein
MSESRWRQSWDGFLSRVPPERRASLPASVGALAVLVTLGVWGTLSTFAQDVTDSAPVAQVAQGTLPLPPPGTAPAPPAAPAIPDPEAAKARAAALAAKANIDVTDAWARATPGNSNTAAVYLHIVSAKDGDKLLGADSAIAQKVEVHDDMVQNGVSKMTATGAVDIAAGATVNFMPGGRHFMLMGLKAPLKEGDSFLLTLKFDKAGTQNTAVKILSASATGPAPSASARKGDTTSAVSPPP